MKEKILLFDELSGRHFDTSIEELLITIDEINEMRCKNPLLTTKLNDVYERIDKICEKYRLRPIEIGDNIGFKPTGFGGPLIEVAIEVEEIHGEIVNVFEMITKPEYL